MSVILTLAVTFFAGMGAGLGSRLCGEGTAGSRVGGTVDVHGGVAGWLGPAYRYAG